MQDGQKAVWSLPYVSVSFFPSLKQNFIAYRSWVYSNSCCICSFEPEIIKIGQSCHKMYSNNIVNFQESTAILNAYKNSMETFWRHLVVWFRVISSFSWDTVFYLFFLSSPLVWWCPLPIFPSIFKFPFLQAFWSSLGIVFRFLPLCVISRFSFLAWLIFPCWIPSLWSDCIFSQPKLRFLIVFHFWKTVWYRPCTLDDWFGKVVSASTFPKCVIEWHHCNHK